jgi:hypothetical protein
VVRNPQTTRYKPRSKAGRQLGTHRSMLQIRAGHTGRTGSQTRPVGALSRLPTSAGVPAAPKTPSEPPPSLHPSKCFLTRNLTINGSKVVFILIILFIYSEPVNAGERRLSLANRGEYSTVRAMNKAGARQGLLRGGPTQRRRSQRAAGR